MSVDNDRSSAPVFSYFERIPSQYKEWCEQREQRAKLIHSIIAQYNPTADSLLDNNVIDIITDYIEPFNQTFLPLVQVCESGQDWPVECSKFGGAPYLPSQDQSNRTECAVCHHPMIFFFQLYNHDLPLSMQWIFVPPSLEHAINPLFQLWVCLNEDVEQIENNPSKFCARWIDASGQTIPSIPSYRGPRLFIPQPKKLIGWTEAVDYLPWPWHENNVEHINSQCVNGVKLSGHPYYKDRNLVDNCHCGAARELFIQFAEGPIFPQFFDTDPAFITVCPYHRDSINLRAEVPCFRI